MGPAGIAVLLSAQKRNFPGPTAKNNGQPMKILDVLNKEAINVDMQARDKKGVLDELVAPVAAAAGENQEKLVKVLLERERLGSTGIGGGIGIPHGKLKNLQSLILS